jgi:YVTN family beta-propeller protein
MKNFNLCRYAVAAGSALLLALCAVNPAMAANPLNGPRGLALAANGNLYVANSGANNVIVFNPNYNQVTAKTISTGIDKPVGVAFDSSGNLYVANGGSSSVTEYSSTGSQITKGTITQDINNPQSIAVDGVDNIYVANNFQDVTVYAGTAAPSPNGPVLMQTYNPQLFLSGIATHGQFLCWGTTNVVQLQYVDQTLIGDAGGGVLLGIADEAIALAFDQSGNVYVVNANQTVNYVDFANGLTYSFASLGFNGEGIVVDSVRGRVYISNQLGNSIAVYSTSGTLLKTIQ